MQKYKIKMFVVGRLLGLLEEALLDRISEVELPRRGRRSRDCCWATHAEMVEEDEQG